MPSEPRLGVPPPISGWTDLARKQTTRLVRNKCTECYSDYSTAERDRNPMATMVIQEHAGRWHGFDMVREQHADFYLIKDYVWLDVPNWKLALFMVPNGADNRPQWAQEGLKTSLFKILVPPRTSTRLHMVACIKQVKPLSAVNGRQMANLVKSAFDLQHMTAPMGVNEFTGHFDDPTFALFATAQVGVAMLPIMVKEEVIDASMPILDATAEGEPMTCAIDPYRFKPRGMGGDDLPPLVGFRGGSPLWARRLADMPGTGSGLPQWLAPDAIYLEDPMPPLATNTETTRRVFQHGTPAAMQQGNVEATRREYGVGEEMPPCEGPICAPMAVAEMNKEFCAFCITRIMAQQRTLSQQTAGRRHTWQDLERMLEAQRDELRRTQEMVQIQREGTQERDREHDRAGRAGLGRERYERMMAAHGIATPEMRAEFEEWRRAKRTADVEHFVAASVACKRKYLATDEPQTLTLDILKKCVNQ